MNGRPTRIRYEHPYYADIINISVNPSKINYSKIAEMYLHKGYSASQIAEKIGLSKTVILDRLHALDIRVKNGKSRVQNPKNYRAPNPPYGYHVVENQLVVCKKQIRICKLIIQLIDNEKLSLNKTARELVYRKVKNSKGRISWDHSMVKAIYTRWRGKI